MAKRSEGHHAGVPPGLKGMVTEDMVLHSNNGGASARGTADGKDGGILANNINNDGSDGGASNGNDATMGDDNVDGRNTSHDNIGDKVGKEKLNSSNDDISDLSNDDGNNDHADSEQGVEDNLPVKVVQNVRGIEILY
jgi:hypothetical protein